MKGDEEERKEVRGKRKEVGRKKEDRKKCEAFNVHSIYTKIKIN